MPADNRALDQIYCSAAVGHANHFLNWRKPRQHACRNDMQCLYSRGMIVNHKTKLLETRPILRRATQNGAACSMCAGTQQSTESLTSHLQQRSSRSARLNVGYAF